MFNIGAKNWVRDLRAITKPLGSDFWSQFTPVDKCEIDLIESKIQRKLDQEFREFYQIFGYGCFHHQDQNCGNIYSPAEIMECIPNPIFFNTGSMTPGSEWASLDEHFDLWLTRGKSITNRCQFTEDVLTLDGVKLYDLLQFGTDGMCGYHHLFVGPEPAPLRYCLLTESQELEDRSITFSEGLTHILRKFLDNLP